MQGLSLRVLVAPSGFKECLLAEDVAKAIAKGVRAACPDAKIDQLPLVDGGEGFAAALASATDGSIESIVVTGPVGAPVEAQLGWLGGPARIAVVELAQAAGLRLVPHSARNPMHTTSYGVGELITAAFARGAERILIGCGDSGVNDGGAGLAQALGARLLDADGHEIERGCAGLASLTRIDVAGLDPRLQHTPVEVACNTRTALLGPRGVAHVFGPQKGADAEMVALMERAMTRYAAIMHADLGVNVREAPGAGASGGVGAALLGFLGAEMRQREEIVFRFFDIDDRLARADLVITAEGGIDLQTPNGKIPAEVGRRAKARGLPVFALAGCVGADARVVYQYGIEAFFSTCIGPCELAQAMRDAEQHLALTAENLMRAVNAGATLGALERAA